MIRSYFFPKTGEIRLDVDPSEYPALLKDPEGVLWVDFESTPPETDEPLLRTTFGFHPLAIDDALQESHVPKLDDWGEYLYIVLHSVSFDLYREEELNTLELDIFLGMNYIITHHDTPIPALDKLRDILQRDDRHVRHGTDHLLYRMVDEVVAGYMPVVEAIDDAIDLAEDEVFVRPTPRTLERIFRIKRAALQLRRVIGPQREVLNRLARDEIPVIDAQARVYFRDVYDHLVRLHDISESLRDLVSGTLDTYLSVINNRMNDTMKTLTIITTLFMPLSFITGFFGMNFFVPEPPISSWVTLPVFYIALFVILITPVIMYQWLRSRGWA